MSAYMHSNSHINAILNAAQVRQGQMSGFSWYFNGVRTDLNRADMDALGAMLLRQNAESVAHRYDLKNLEATDDGNRPMEYLEYLEQADRFRFHSHMIDRLSPIAAIKAIHSYEYQACEHPGWEASEAFAFLQQLAGYLVTCTPEYVSAPTWSIQDRKPTELRSGGAVDLTMIPEF